MYDYMKRHETLVRAALSADRAGVDWAELTRVHAVQLGYMQHERLIHLLVTLSVALFALLTLLFFIVHPTVAVGVLVLLLLVLFVPYVVHYFRLENGVQRWYDLANEIERRARPA